MLKYIVFLLMLSCAGQDLYESVIPGCPVGGGRVVGGMYQKSDIEQCTHDDTITMMKKQALKNSNRWELLSFGSAIISTICVFAWYLTKIPQIGGCAIVGVIWSVICLLISEIVLGTVWMALLITGAILVIGIGCWLHKKSVSSLWRKKDGIQEKES